MNKLVRTLFGCLVLVGVLYGFSLVASHPSSLGENISNQIQKRTVKE